MTGIAAVGPSRSSALVGLGSRAEPLRLDVLAREESVQFLSPPHRPQLTRTASTELAGLVGDLPLALEEAAAYLEQTGIGLGEYLGLLRARAADLFGLARGRATRDGGGGAEGDQRRVATVWSVSLERVTTAAPAAADLLQLCAFLAPDYPARPAARSAAVVTESLPDSSLGRRWW